MCGYPLGMWGNIWFSPGKGKNEILEISVKKWKKMETTPSELSAPGGAIL
jgi:hypothetical protein